MPPRESRTRKRSADRLIMELGVTPMMHLSLVTGLSVLIGVCEAYESCPCSPSRGGSIAPIQLDFSQSQDILGTRRVLLGSYYLGYKHPETISFVTVGTTERLELTTNHYYQRKDWTGTIRYKMTQAGKDWWRPALIVGVHDLGSPRMTEISLAAIRTVSAPRIEEVTVHAGVTKQTRANGHSRGVGGVTKSFSEHLDLSVLYDGSDAHTILGTHYGGFHLSVMAFRMRYFAGGVSYQFEF